MTNSLEAVIRDTLVASGKATALRLRGLRAAAEPEIKGFKFDATDPDATDWVKTRAAKTISGITKTTQEEIRELVEQAFTGQMDVDALADDIENLIGDEERAELIARTETMTAANRGQQEAWDQATEAGLLSGNEKQEWIISPDEKLCPVCEPLDGVLADLGENFVSPDDGEEYEGPPAHPNCRCTLGLVVPRAAWLDPATGVDDHGRGPGGRGPGGRGPGGGKDRTRVDRARASHNPATRDKHIIATQQEQIVAKAIGGRIEAGNAPIDVWTDHSAVEVKTIVGGKNAKITMHPASRMRKEAAAKKAGKAPHTVAIDHRGPKPIYYHRAGYGSYRLEHMARVSLSQLKERIK